MRRPALAAAALGALLLSGAKPAEPLFVDATDESRLSFRHVNGMAGDFTLAEVMGSGVALLDYDGDGDLDVYLVQQTSLPGAKRPAAAAPTGTLLRNDLTVRADGTRAVRFTDVTAKAGLAFVAYGMGVAAGDYDNDGHVDLYVTCIGSNHLLRNRGDGTFFDVTARAHVDDPRWSSSATFFDYDRDGFLDLYVAAYVDWERDPKHRCYAASSARDFCGPQSYRPLVHRLFHNRKDGTFEDVTDRSGVGKVRGSGLGVLSSDLDGDLWPDLFVANDGDADFLFLNNHDGTFREEALLAGVAVNGQGKALASMGVDAADADGDGREDLFVSNIMQEGAALFRNLGEGLFEDRTAAAGLAATTRGKTGFGARFVDFDSDGFLDLVMVNGAVHVLPERARKGDPYPLAQTKDLFRNRGNGVFEVATALAGPAFARPEVSRGLAVGDVDGDGRPDLVVSNSAGDARLLLNRAKNANRWLGLRLLSREGRDALGARVEVRREKGPPLHRRVRSDGSYLSAGDPRVLVGLGPDPGSTSVRVVWPGGREESWPPFELDRYHVLREGTAPGGAR